MYEQCNNGATEYTNPFSHQINFSTLEKRFCPKYIDGAKGNKNPFVRHALGVRAIATDPQISWKARMNKKTRMRIAPDPEGKSLYLHKPIQSKSPAKLTHQQYFPERPNLCRYGTIFLRFPFCFLRGTLVMRKRITISKHIFPQINDLKTSQVKD